MIKIKTLVIYIIIEDKKFSVSIFIVQNVITLGVGLPHRHNLNCLSYSSLLLKTNNIDF